ncbi:phage portal protein [Aureimonas pseudogalii]|uniref:Lambda family phage portal protein n=1 Tax=Aureimonas pseudogalii TaxID=1744844 RepID=A0A7W6H5E5_9HYPH|nr:phage portal protein [Aureimonas pseudogalii]MBB3998871.1 lambda family phage portal protein [Aureimonas pseudogalii]
MPVRLPSFLGFLNRADRRGAVRRFEAAGGGRRWGGTPHFGRTSTEVAAATATVRSRARHAAANHPYIANGVAALVTGLVGTGITPTSQHADADTRDRLATLFDAWNADADHDERTDGYGLQAAAMQAMVVDGEAFVLMRHGDDDRLKLQLLPAELCDESLTRTTAHGYIVNGVEFDAEGRRIAYWLLPHRPTDAFAGNAAPAQRVAAEDVIHLFRPLGAGQVRGLSWLAPVLLTASEFDKLADALVMNAQVQAMFVGLVTDVNGTAGGSMFDGDQAGNVLETGLQPGTLQFLPSGYDVRWSTPQAANQAVETARLTLEAIAAGLGVPAHLLSGDLRQANYSSLRAALVSFRQRLEAVQFHTIIPQLCRPVWERFVSTAVLLDDLDLDDPREGFACEWLPPAQPWVDPVKDAQATREMMAAGLMSRRQAVAALGYSIERLDAEIAADRAREARLGLTFAAPAGPTNPEEPAE